jgi:hypothetical protein
MKYAKPMFMTLSGALSGWCNVGSNGVNADNNCAAGITPTTTQCKTGAANTHGHCITGSTVANTPGSALFCLTGTGGNGALYNDCKNGISASGYTACQVGTHACHCTKGSSA